MIVKRALKEAVYFIEKICKVVPSTRLYSSALDIGVRARIPVYDAFFLALAESLKCKVLTCDSKLRDKLVNTPFSNLIECPIS